MNEACHAAFRCPLGCLCPFVLQINNLFAFSPPLEGTPTLGGCTYPGRVCPLCERHARLYVCVNTLNLPAGAMADADATGARRARHLSMMGSMGMEPVPLALQGVFKGNRYLWLGGLSRRPHVAVATTGSVGDVRVDDGLSAIEGWQSGAIAKKSTDCQKGLRPLPSCDGRIGAGMSEIALTCGPLSRA